jgi:hypothetical protein
MNAMLDPQISLEPWQVEDYRVLSLESLFSRLKSFNIDLDKAHFIALGETFDSPEDIADSLLADGDADIAFQDQVYLLIFELWRRLLPENPSMSVFCDELDHQIYTYDNGEAESVEPIQDALSRLQDILEENVDQGAEQTEAFDYVSAGCANDLESFLYDFIAEQIDSEAYSYAQELLETFTPYVNDPKWFELLQVRTLAVTDEVEANRKLRNLVQEAFAEPDLEFNFEVLSFLVEEGEHDIFISVVKQSLNLIETEESFQELLTVCADYYHRLDKESQEAAVQMLLEERSGKPLQDPLPKQDPHLIALVKILGK